MLAIGTEVFDIRSKISAKSGLKRFLSGQMISNLFKNAKSNIFACAICKPIQAIKSLRKVVKQDNRFNSYPNSFKSRPVKPIKSKLIDETNDSKYLT